MPLTERSGQILTDISISQRERLAYVELRSYFFGILRRADLESRFGIASAAATRDLAAYREFAPRNLEYDPVQRYYQPTSQFQPLFKISDERTLTWLLLGFGDGLPGPKNGIPSEALGSLMTPDFRIVAAITRAIHGNKSIKARYISTTSGPSERELVPLALGENGQRWHVRAFDRRANAFRDFVLTRFTAVEPSNTVTTESEQLAADEQWQRIVDLELTPHPALAWPSAIEVDYSMVDGCLRIKLRAALVGYALQRWRVDCSPAGTLPSQQYQLRLRNLQTLYGVESAILAPGYRPEVAA